MDLPTFSLSDTVHACELILACPDKWGPEFVERAKVILAECKRDLDGPDDDCTTHEELRLRKRLRLTVDVMLGVPGAAEAAAQIAEEEARHFREFIRHGMWQPTYRSKP